jgi:hypothetical protein
MLMPLVSLLATGWISGPHGPVTGPVLHSVAEVNDPRSHGVVGDGLLSLNEAIQLFNRTLSTSQLSAAEQSRLSGAGADIALARIDAGFAPNIMVERDFDALMNWPHGLMIESYNGRAVIDFSGPGVTGGFRSDCDFCSWRNLELIGGPFAIDLVQTDATFGGMSVQDVYFVGQTQFAMRVGAAPVVGGGRVVVGDCVFVSCPQGILFDETPPDRSSTFAVVDTRFLFVGSAIDCRLGNGGQSSYLFDSISTEGGTTGLRVQRPQGADRSLVVEATHLSISATDCMLCEGVATASTLVQLRMLDLAAAAGGAALSLGLPGGGIVGVLQDSSMLGDVAVACGPGPNLQLANLRFRAGSVGLETSASTRLLVDQSRFDACSVTTSGQAMVSFADCCFVGGGLQGTAVAPVELTSCFNSATLGGHVTQFVALPAAQLGCMDVTPLLPALGGFVTLDADLPSGLLGLFVIGPQGVATEPLPGLRAYLDVASSQIAAIVQGQPTLQVPVPVSLSLLGTRWITQLVVVPSAGVQAPALQAPPGGRFRF